MTEQAKEVIMYRGKYYSFNGQPLDFYLLKHQNIKFDYYTSGNARGYQGFWKLENDQLFLTRFENANFSLNDIFGQEPPVFADWFSGYLTMEIEDIKEGNWSPDNDYKLWLNLDKGIVKQRHIIKSIESDFVIDFGKYKGKQLSDVIKGKIGQSFYFQYEIKAYLKEILNFFQDVKYHQKVIMPYLLITKEIKEVVSDFRLSQASIMLARNFIAIEKRFDTDSEGDKESERFSKLLEQILLSGFKSVTILMKYANPDANIADETLLINPDLNYLNWAMKTIDKFSIAPHLIEKGVNTKYLKNFTINRLNSTIFEYEPNIEVFKHFFPKQTLQINRKKFQLLHKVDFDSDNEVYIVKLPQNELNMRFGHFLDEAYFTPVHKPKTDFGDTYYEQVSSYDKYNGAYGYDDDTIDNAYEGDPENTWNTD